MKTSFFLIICTCAALHHAPAGEYALQESFVTHLKLGGNADSAAKKYNIVIQDWGFSGTTYKPYSTPAGRRIGFGLPVAGPSDYTLGITRVQADTRLRQAVSAAVADLTAAIPSRMPGHTFIELDNARQEVLIDLTITDGVDNLPYELLDTVFNYPSDWRVKLGENESYIRRVGPLLDVLRNRAFAWRHLDNNVHHAGDPLPN